MASHFVCEKFLFGLYCKLSDLFQLMYGLVYSCLPTTTPLDDLREAFMEKWLLNFAQLKIALKFDTMLQIKNRFLIKSVLVGVQFLMILSQNATFFV